MRDALMAIVVSLTLVSVGFWNDTHDALAQSQGGDHKPAPDAAAIGNGYPVRPYVDPNQLDVPWPKHSHYRQPWRAYMETRSAHGFLGGIGVAYHVPGNDELAMRLLAEAGFRAIRLEMGWGGVRWDETGFGGEKRYKAILELCRKHAIRPTILLNAHQGVPCPVKFFSRRLVADAPKASRSVRLTDVKDIVPGRSGLSNLTDYWAAEALITSVDEKTGLCELSKPLAKDLAAGAAVPLATLKYLPLYPVGAKEFDETAAGWTRYALLACKLVGEAGIDDFDVEIWNELTFGTRFLNVNNYHEKPVVKAGRGGGVPGDFLREGGTCWELARRTIEAVKSAHPPVRCIWGFSNTTFFHTPVDKLPPRTDGQSYHPYGTGTRKLPDREPHRDRPDFNIEGFTPAIDIRMPEGWAHTFVQTECLIRLINPQARKRTPPGTARFYHYITEHGVVPGECGVSDEAGAWALKTHCLLRSMCLWLHKGIDVMHYFCAHNDKFSGMGLLPPHLKGLPADAPFDQAATGPLKALRSLTRAFAGAKPLAQTRPLSVDAAALGPGRKIFDGDAAHPPLWDRDVLAFLPFQLDDGRFAVAVYVMTYDATKPMAEQRYRLRVRGLGGATKAVSLHDPIQDKPIALEVLSRGGGEVTVELPVVDYPRVLELRTGEDR